MADRTLPRRYAKACDACHKKKIRCVYSDPACELCRKTGQRCKFPRIEKALPNRPRSVKYFAALEQRMMNMENLLQKSREKPTEKDEAHPPPSSSIYDQELKAINSRDPLMRSQNKEHDDDLQLPDKQQAMRLAYGYFIIFNQIYPIFDKDNFFQRIEGDYPPSKQADFIWWNTVVVVLCFAHRLRAMSTPGQAEAENEEACRYLKAALDATPRVTYEQPSLATASMLLGVAATMRGTKISHPSSMLLAAAIRMLQQLGVHNDDDVAIDVSERNHRKGVFWLAYMLDKDDSFQTGSPPLLQDRDIGRSPPARDPGQGIGMVQSLDSGVDFNLLAASITLARIQSQVWDRILSAQAKADKTLLQSAQDDLNAALMTWKSELPFAFTREALVGHWPKYAIVHIVVLHFRYFQTLVEINKVPSIEKDEIRPLGNDCPVAKLLPRFCHSTDPVTVDAARNALDLASLTPRGNFQIIWLFFNFSISAVLTLLVNGIVRPFDESVSLDLQRVDVWLHVIDKLAKDSDRLDLLEKKDFLSRMRQWTLRVVEEAMSGQSYGAKDLPCIYAFAGSNRQPPMEDQFASDATIWDGSWIPELDDTQAEMFPDGMMDVDALWDTWAGINDWRVDAL